MTTPYLIAHLVRGEPAFDIAIRCDDMGTEDDPSPWWIMPSTGHRCYPYWDKPMADIQLATGEDEGGVMGYIFGDTLPPPPHDHPDFCGYEIAPAEVAQAAIAGQSLLASLGLLKPKDPIKRRI